MVPADSARISRVPAYSGAVLHRADVFAYGAFTLCGAPFQKLPLTFARHAPTVLQPRVMHCYILGLGYCAFARHYLRNHFCFLFLRVMRCFSSPGSPPRLAGMMESPPSGCPIRKSAARRVFAPRRGLSQLVTSFFASESQGILHVPFSPFLFLQRKVAFLFFSKTYSRLLLVLLFYFFALMLLICSFEIGYILLYPFSFHHVNVLFPCL